MRNYLALALMGVLTACSTVSQTTPTGGSRSDGTVEMSFEYGAFDKVKIDEVSALEQAKARCQTWGYSGAEPFGGVTRQCESSNGYGCMRYFATIKYQCTGAATPS